MPPWPMRRDASSVGVLRRTSRSASQERPSHQTPCTNRRHIGGGRLASSSLPPKTGLHRNRRRLCRACDIHKTMEDTVGSVAESKETALAASCRWYAITSSLPLLQVRTSVVECIWPCERGFPSRAAETRRVVGRATSALGRSMGHRMPKVRRCCRSHRGRIPGRIAVGRESPASVGSI